MKKEIKFRAWTDNLKDGGEMYYQREDEYFSPLFSSAGYRLLNPSLKIMQFTGLKDRNGKEIYEGDILMSKNGHHFIADFQLGSFGAHLIGDSGIWDSCATRTFQEKEFVVVGNVYENPELFDKNN